MRYLGFYLVLSILTLSCNSDNNKIDKASNEATGIILNKIPASHSKIEFNNRIQENERLHCFIWNFIYQGAGVGVGDINNDGLPDIYLCGNMVSDKLYLNKGNFVFEDISLQSGIQDKLWSTGVNMVDVNADGLLDIYVCKNFFLLQESVRTNKLFINNGNLSFTEQAEDYGIDDPGFSIQSYFFDADNDHDLDMYLVNQPMDQYAARLASPESLAKLPYSDKFYLNENGKYSDRTDELGFRNQCYGLSAVISDLNRDGWKDLYLCNDYQQGDKLYINKGSLAFEESIKERMDHSSFYSMGSDVDDINNDGQPDIISLDMAFKEHFRSKTNMESMRPDLFNRLIEEGNHYQYPVNNLHLNKHDAYFSEIAHYSGVSHTDWSWSALFTDLNLDGHSDLLVSNGILRDLRNNDFIQELKKQSETNSTSQDYRVIMNKIPSTPVSNVVYRNTGKLKFEDVTDQSGFDEKNFSSGMAIADLDLDGDMDVIINNTNGLAGIYRNDSDSGNNYIKVRLKGPENNPQGLSCTVIAHLGAEQMVRSISSARAYMSSCEAEALFGIPDCSMIDSIEVVWDHEHVSILKDPGCNKIHTIDFDSRIRRQIVKDKQAPILVEARIIEHKHSENTFDEYATQVLLPHMISTQGPFMEVLDINNDGADDLIISGPTDSKTRVLVQNTDGQLTDLASDALNSSLPTENMESALIDLDNDGDKDIYLVSGGAQHSEGSEKLKDLILINEGKGQFQKALELEGSDIDGQSVLVTDLNGDGMDDLFLGGRSMPGKYGLKADSKLFINSSEGLVDMTESLCPEMKGLGMVTDAIAMDHDNDGDMDVIIVGEWMPITLLENKGQRFELSEILFEGNKLSGWWWCLEKADMDNDGDMDLIAGNLGENNKFKPGDQTPMKLYAGDIDRNGDHDIILAKTKSDILIPVRGKECSTEEMPFISDKFKSYGDFARASLSEIHEFNELEENYQSEVNDFSHYYFENLGEGDFKAHKLPFESQTSLIKSLVLRDLNADGNIDILYAGNHYDTEPETVRYDAGGIAMCLGNGDGSFRHISTSELGVVLKEDVKDIEMIRIKEKDYVLVGINNGKLRSFLLQAENIPD